MKKEKGRGKKIMKGVKDYESEPTWGGRTLENARRFKIFPFCGSPFSRPPLISIEFTARWNVPSVGCGRGKEDIYERQSDDEERRHVKRKAAPTE